MDFIYYLNLETVKTSKVNRNSTAWISSRGDSVIQMWFKVPMIQEWIQGFWITSWITLWIMGELPILTVPIVVIFYNVEDYYHLNTFVDNYYTL